MRLYMKIRQIKSINLEPCGWKRQNQSVLLHCSESTGAHTQAKLKHRPQTNTSLWSERLISFRISPLSQSIDSPLRLRPQCLDSQTFAALLHSATMHTAEVREVKSSMSSNHTLVLHTIHSNSKSADMLLKRVVPWLMQHNYFYVLMPLICNMYI